MAKINTKKIEKIAGKAFDKMFGKRLANASLESQVKFLKRMMIFPNSMPRVRIDLLEGLPDDIKDKLEAGQSDTEIKDYYWNCEAFRDLWTKDLQMEEATFDVLLKNTCIAFVEGN